MLGIAIYILMSSDNETNNIEEFSEELPQSSQSKLTTKSFAEHVDAFKTEFEAYKTAFEGLKEKQEQYNNTKKEFEQEMKQFNKYTIKMFKIVEDFTSKINKAHVKDKIKKPRKKTENSGKSGFNKPQPVPEPLRLYLELDEEVELTRPQILKELNSKFKEHEFKEEGGITVIKDKKVAKMLGVKKGFELKSNEYHKFIAGFFKKENDDNDELMADA